MLRVAFVLRSTEVHPEFYGFVCGHALGVVPLVPLVQVAGSCCCAVVCSQLLFVMPRNNPSAFHIPASCLPQA